MNTNQEHGRQDADATVGANKASSAPWYRRRAFLVGLGGIVVLAITVISDLPVHGSLAANISAGQSVMSEVNSDVAPCAFAVKESFSIHADEVAGSLTPSDRHEAPALMRDDLAACSFTDNSIFDLSNIEVPGSAAGKRLGDVVDTVTLWATSDALGAITDLQVLLNQPKDASAKQDLASRETALAADRADAFADISAADQILSAHLPEPEVPALPNSGSSTG
jgi:hypothetical protein